MPTDLPPEMFAYYAGYVEAERLDDASGDLERTRTQELMRRYLPDPPAVILDVGGATGVHALWLAAQGHEVHLIDPVAHHVAQAQRASHEQGDALASCTVGDARDLAHADGSVDAVLLLGPLYHLVEAPERGRALAEAWRVLRPGGVLIAAAVSRYASLHTCLSLGLLDDDEFVEVVRQDLATGQHRNPPGRPYFTTTYFHRPADLRGELTDAGFASPRLVAVEGPAMWAPTFDTDWAEPRKRELILDLVRVAEEDEVMLGAGAHFLGIGHR